MSIYEEIKYKTPNLSTFYRFEGTSAFYHHDFQQKRVLPNTSSYIYYSKSLIHHNYYVRQKLKQLINLMILTLV